MPSLPDEALVELAESMRDGDAPSGWGGTPQGGDNPRIPAGYTYLGQFIDHDITFDPVSSFQRQNDPDALHDFRSPRFDLDSLYGSGPIDEPFQYARSGEPRKLLIEANRNGIDDLPRNSQDVALIGDPRNDENTIVGQLHLLFLRLHNKIADEVTDDDTVLRESKFDEVQTRVRWHYQWMLLYDLLPRVIGDDMFKRIVTLDDSGGFVSIQRPFYRPRNQAYMPVEFSAAAFRYGHSQVRGIYDLNSSVTERPIFVSGPLPHEFADLRGFRRLPQGWTVDWSLFLPISGSAPQPSRRVDARLVPALFDLPEGGSLPFRNLKRGQALGLPSGQDVARYLRVERVLTGAELGAPEPTPLWFYILKESELVAGGEHLGPVGGRIVGDVLAGLLELDKRSWINVNPSWRPTVPDGDGDGRFALSDLAAFAAA